MLDGLSKKILRFMLSELNGDGKQYFDFDADVEKMANDFAVGSDTVLASIRYLNNEGFIKYAYSGDTALYFYLDHKGLHQEEFDKLQSRERWKERAFGFFSGILVTVLTELFIKAIS